MANSLSDNQTTGIILIVLGLVALAGWLNSIIILVAGIALLVYGILGLLGKARLSQLVSVICIIAGALLILGWLPFLGKIVGVLILIVGVVLVVVGILKLMGKM